MPVTPASGIPHPLLSPMLTTHTHTVLIDTHTTKYWLNIFYVYEWFPYMYVSAPDAHLVSPEVRRECWIPSALSN